MNTNIPKINKILLLICFLYSCKEENPTTDYYIDKYIIPSSLNIKINEDVNNILICELNGAILRAGTVEHEKYASLYGDNNDMTFPPLNTPFIADTCYSVDLIYSDHTKNKEIHINEYAQIIYSSCKYSIQNKQIRIDYITENNEVKLNEFNLTEHLLLEGKFLIKLAPPYNSQKGSYKVSYKYNNHTIVSNSITKE